MRSCPEWFQQELTRIGGVNPSGEPIFKLIWSPSARHIIGGAWSTGYVGYREVSAVSGTPCWALMVWEPKETQGTPFQWEWDYRDPESGLLECGAFPSAGRYRILKRFLHRELIRQAEERHYLDHRGDPQIEVIARRELAVYRLEPSGLILDILLPMLMAWRRLTDVAKKSALKQDEQMRKNEFLAKSKDARDGCRIMRGSELVRRRAEVIENGLAGAMKAATRMGLGMRLSA